MSRKNDAIRRISREGYFVSDDGRTVTSSFGNILKLYHTERGKGYLELTVRGDDGRTMSIPVHRLQAYQKFGKKMFKKGVQVRHLDGNSMNNSWDNMGIGTQSDNMMDIPSDERILNASNPIHDHSEIISDWQGGMSYSKIMKKYSIPSKGTVSFIINKSLESQK